MQTDKSSCNQPVKSKLYVWTYFKIQKILRLYFQNLFYVADPVLEITEGKLCGRDYYTSFFYL